MRSWGLGSLGLKRRTTEQPGLGGSLCSEANAEPPDLLDAKESSRSEPFEAPEPEAEAETEQDAEERWAQMARTVLEGNSEDSDERRVCPSCGRKFNPASFQRHHRVCQKVFGSQRPQFDPMRGSAIATKAAVARCAVIPPATTSAPSQTSPMRQRPVPSVAMAEEARKGVDAQPTPHLPTSGTHPPVLRTPPQRAVESEDAEMNLSALELAARRPSWSASIPSKFETPEAETEADVAAPRTPLVKSLFSSPSPRASHREFLEERESRVRLVMEEQMQELRRLRRVSDPESVADTLMVTPEHWTPEAAPVDPEEEEEEVFEEAEEGETREVASVQEDDSGFKFLDALESPEAQPEMRHPSPRLETEVSGFSRRNDFYAEEPPPSPSTFKTCEECGRRFNPLSFEKHRAVCKSVFGVKGRAPAQPSVRLRTSGGSQLLVPADSGTGGVDATSSIPSSSSSRPGKASPRPPDLIPCIHCGRSFRPAGLEKHEKVCQSVFPTVDRTKPRRNVGDGRTQKVGDSPATGFRTMCSTPPQPVAAVVHRAASPKPSREAPGVQRQASPLGIRRSASAVHMTWTPPPVFRSVAQGECQTSPRRAVSAIWPHDMRSSHQDGAGGRAGDFAVIRVATTDASQPDLRSVWEDRRTLLERARLGVKMGQLPPHALLSGSSSEAVLRQASTGEYRLIPDPPQQVHSCLNSAAASSSSAPHTQASWVHVQVKSSPPCVDRLSQSIPSSAAAEQVAQSAVSAFVDLHSNVAVSMVHGTAGGDSDWRPPAWSHQAPVRSQPFHGPPLHRSATEARPLGRSREDPTSPAASPRRATAAASRAFLPGGSSVAIPSTKVTSGDLGYPRSESVSKRGLVGGPPPVSSTPIAGQLLRRTPRSTEVPANKTTIMVSHSVASLGTPASQPQRVSRVIEGRVLEPTASTPILVNRQAAAISSAAMAGHTVHFRQAQGAPARPAAVIGAVPAPVPLVPTQAATVTQASAPHLSLKKVQTTQPRSYVAAPPPVSQGSRPYQRLHH